MHKILYNIVEWVNIRVSLPVKKKNTCIPASSLRNQAASAFTSQVVWMELLLLMLAVYILTNWKNNASPLNNNKRWYYLHGL
jgi:hypothetical protein